MNIKEFRSSGHELVDLIGDYLENVEFTQYFLAGGYALHGNYWTPEANFGGFTSNGCVGLMNHDAEFFWNWMNPGDYISIHY